jgi:hypothetical protein
MVLEEFDKLKQLVERVITKYRQINFQKVKLEKENAELKKKLEVFERIGSEDEVKHIDELHLENERLRQKKDKVKDQLEQLLNELEQKITIQNGVDS